MANEKQIEIADSFSKKKAPHASKLVLVQSEHLNSVEFPDSESLLERNVHVWLLIQDQYEKGVIDGEGRTELLEVLGIDGIIDEYGSATDTDLRKSG